MNNRNFFSPTCRHALSRRQFVATASIGALALALRDGFGQPPAAANAAGDPAPAAGVPTHPLIDIHMHQTPTSRRGAVDADIKAGKKTGGSATRTEAQFVTHQKNINAVASVILGANDYEYDCINQDPSKYIRFASAGPGAGDRAAPVENALKKGAKGIGETRYEGETAYTTRLIELARDYKVPILFHFQQRDSPEAVFANFYKYVEKYPTVTFIGHANDWWGGIDKNYSVTGPLYPTGKVTPGGLSDVWLTRYPNLYADLSATSGNTALLRDPDFAKDFVIRHQDKLMFGSDCPCTRGDVATCWSVIKLVALNQLRLSETVKQKIYLSNAAKMFGVKVPSA